MGHVSHDRFASRFSFSEDDLVQIDGRPMRLRHRNSEDCSFEPEGGGLTEYFTHPQITALQRRNRITIEGRHFVAQGVRHVLERGDRLHSLVDGTLEERIRFREAVVLGFREVQRKQMDTTGRLALKRTDASITAHSSLISMEAEAFDAKTAARGKASDPHEVHAAQPAPLALAIRRHGSRRAGGRTWEVRKP